MLPSESIILWLSIANCSSLSLFLIVTFFLPRSTSREIFRLFLLSYVAFANPLLAVQLMLPEDRWMPLCSTLIHANGVFFVMLLGHFLLSIADPKELRSWRFRLFYANFGLLLLCALFRLIEQGAELSETGLRPRPGLLHPYFTLTMLSFAAYFCWVSWHSYRSSKEPLVKHQVKALAYTAFPASLMFLATNAVVPALTQNYTITPVGSLWFLILFAGILYVLWAGRALIVTNSLRRISSSPLLRLPENVRTISDCIEDAGQAVSELRVGQEALGASDRDILGRHMRQLPEALAERSGSRVSSFESGGSGVGSLKPMKSYVGWPGLMAVGALSFIGALVVASLVEVPGGGRFEVISVLAFLGFFATLGLSLLRRVAYIKLLSITRRVLSRREFEDESRLKLFQLFLDRLASILERFSSQGAARRGIDKNSLMDALAAEEGTTANSTQPEVRRALGS